MKQRQNFADDESSFFPDSLVALLMAPCALSLCLSLSVSPLQYLYLSLSISLSESLLPASPLNASESGERRGKQPQKAKQTWPPSRCSRAGRPVTERPPPPPPLAVEYDPITGIPAEFNEYLPSNCDEYKR